MISDTNKFFNKEIETIQVQIKRHTNKVLSMKQELDLVNKKY